ncbi:MAG: hypothetical protein PHU23_15100 [Dehalococcoidales bacterium]|nr:hypothetical protein [Dehalococcoidales bacterium]
MADMPECELISVCPLFKDNPEEISQSDEILGLEKMAFLKEKIKEEYCRGKYGRCGRYQLYMARGNLKEQLF